MRTFLTFIAVALVTALTVALVAPPLIDWSARREMVARAISERIGVPVAISGPITLRILPTAYLEIADVEIGPRGAPFLKGPAMRFEFGLLSLFGGKLRLDDVAFEHPSVHLGPDLAPPGEGPLQFEHVKARGAEIRIERAGAAPILMHGLDFEGSAASARGPYRGGGDFALSGASRASYQFAADAFQGGTLPLRVEIAAGAARAALDGRIKFAAAPAYEGTATVSGEAPAPDGGVWPWRLAGEFGASGDEARFDRAKVSLGPDARALEAEGGLALKFGDQLALDADLKARTLNFDSLLRRDKETSATPARAAQAFAALVQRALTRDAPLAAFSLKLEAASAFLGARPLGAPKLSLSGASSGPIRMALHSGLPGRSQIDLDGEGELGAAPIFRGKAALEVGEFAPLAGWLSQGDSARAAQLVGLQAALPAGPISAASSIEASAQGFSARGLKLDVANSHFQGDAIYRRPDPDRAGSLYLDLASDALDIEVAPNIGAGFDFLGGDDLDFRLSAKTLRVARVGLASVQGGSLTIRARKQGAKFALERFALADLGGASIEAEGETSPAGRWTRVKLDAGRLHDFAALLARAAPSALTQWLLQRADDLGSAKATIEARRDGPPLDGPFGLDFLKADGEIAATRFGLTLTRAPAPVDAITAVATLDAPDAGALLRKLGADIPAGPPGRAELSLSGTGRWDSGFEGKARLALAGAEFNWKGALRPDEATLAGPLTLKSADLVPSLAALGMATSGTGLAAPADLAADFEATPNGAKVTKLGGVLAGSRVKGELAFASPKRKALSLDQLVAMAKSDEDTAVAPSPPAVTGALEFDRASASALLALTLGRAGPVRPGALWSESKFAAPLLTPPKAEIALKIGAIDVGWVAGKALSARLRLDRGALALDDLSMALNGGKASGRLSLRRDRTLATASGALRLEGVAVERPALHARLDADLDFVGAGGTAAGLAAGLAGAGRATLSEAKWPRLDPDGLGRVMAKVEQAAGPPPETVPLTAAIGAELDRAPLTLSGASSPLALSSGALRFGPFDEPAREGSVSLSGALDFADLSLSVDTTLIYDKTGPFWSGPPPTIEVAGKGPLEGLSRKIDVSLLSASLASEAIARESDRIANFEADIRERAAFNRRLKADRFLARREAEVAAFEADEERQRLMDNYLAPYTAWAASRRGREAAKEAAAPGL